MNTEPVCAFLAQIAAQALSIGLQFPKQRHPAALEALSFNSEGITLLLLA